MTLRVNQLDHVNVQTTRLAETVRFYADVLDLRVGDPPPPLDPGLVQWMFDAENRAIFHLTTPGSMVNMAQINAADDTGAVHHVALDCSGYHEMIDRLDGKGVHHHENHVTAIDLRQIFVKDPNGVLLELNYRAGNH